MSWYSIGSSMVMMFFSGELIRVEGGVKGGGLAAAGRSGNQDDAAGPGEEPFHGPHIGRGETDIGQRDDPPLLVEETEHHPFAEKGGDDGYADVHIPSGDDDPESPVLGEPFLGDVQSRHDLHPGNKGILHDLGGSEHLVEESVDPEAHLHFPFERLDVDVAGPFLDRLEDDGVQEPDHRRLVGELEEILRYGEFGGNGGEVFSFQFLHHLLGRARQSRVEAVDGIQHDSGRDRHAFHGRPVNPLQFIDCQEVGGISDCHQEPAVLQL